MKLFETINNLFTLKNEPNQKRFDDVNQKKDISNSVVDSYFSELEKRGENLGGYLDVNAKEDLPLVTILTDKYAKIGTFNGMAENDIISDAIDEIKDASLNFDENGNCIELNISNSEELKIDEIINEFSSFVNIYDLKKKLPEYVKTLLVEGELCWENIINIDDPADGIISTRIIKNESYEFAINTETSKRVGITIFDNKSEVDSEYIKRNLDIFNNATNSKFNLNSLSASNRDISDTSLFLSFNQITYCNTGNYTPDGLSIIPILNKTRKPYNQLTLIEDSIIIYRIVRAPERLAFNIDAGTMSPAKAEQLAARLMKKYNTKQVYDKSTGTVNNHYDAMSMLDNYWFVSTNGGTGTKVESVGGTGNSLQDLDDLDYFIKKVYKTLKVPFSRYSEVQTTLENSDSISYEEYKFYKFVVSSLLNPIAQAIKDAFITHIKLKGMWVEGLSSNDFNCNFIPPSSFELYQTQKRLQGKLDIISAYKEIYDYEEFNSYVLKKVNNLTDEEIQTYFESIKQDKLNVAKIAYEIEQMEENGGNPEED